MVYCKNLNKSKEVKPDENSKSIYHVYSLLLGCY
jgi:hypothetical protein